MKIQIKKLIITNFKGIKSLEVPFGDVTHIYGNNATGKTTVMDAFTWLLFGKDSEGKAQFNIKPLDAKNQPMRKADHEVEAELYVDGQTTLLKRIFREKWVKKRGEKEATFSGHETSFFWNDVPFSQKDYQAKVSDIVDEDLFRLLTIPGYFNSLPWKDQRNILQFLVPDVTDEDVAEGNEGFQKFLDSLGNKNIAELKREIASRKKKLKNELDEIPVRIDEIHRSMPEPVDVDAINAEIKTKLSIRDDIEDKIGDLSKANEDVQGQILDLQNSKAHLISDKDDYVFNIRESHRKAVREKRSKYDEIRGHVDAVDRKIRNMENELAEIAPNVDQLEATKETLKNQWYEINGEQFSYDESQSACEACGRAYDEGVIAASKEEQLTGFNERKAKRLHAVTEKGRAVSKDIQAFEIRKEELKKALEEAKHEREQLFASLEQNTPELVPETPEYTQNQKDFLAELDSQIAKIRERIEELRGTPGHDVRGLKEEKRDVEQQIDQLKDRLSVNNRIQEMKKRIADLEFDMAGYAEQLAELEGQEDVANEFTKAKIDLLESRINAMFDYVQFKMYEQQINEGERETCITLINGVPYEDANTAGRINAGIDIINTLGEFHGVQAPIWVDHRESVVNLFETPSQTINLIVNADDKKLRIA